MPGIKGQVQDLYSWLRRSPQPVCLIAHCGDGPRRLPKPPGNKPWRDWVDTLMQLEPLKVEALDKQDQVLRIANLTPEDDATAVLGPAGQVATDPTSRVQSTLVVLATLLAESYTRSGNAFREGAEMARQTMDAANSHLLEMMAMQNQRVLLLERFMLQTQMHAIAQIEEAREIEAEQAEAAKGGVFEEMAGQFLPAMFAGQQAKASAAKGKPPAKAAPKAAGPKPDANGAAES